MIKNRPFILYIIIYWSFFYDSNVLSNYYTTVNLPENNYVCFCKIKIERDWARVAITSILNCNRYFSGILNIVWQSITLPAIAPNYTILLSGAIQRDAYAGVINAIAFTYSESDTTIYGWTQKYDGNFPQILYLMQNLQGAHIEVLDTNSPIYTSSLPGTYGVMLQMQTNVNTSNFTVQYISNNLINESLFN